MSPVDLNRLDLGSPYGLLARLEAVPDPRRKRGVRHHVAQILAIATLATLRGATSLTAIGEVASELPEEALVALRCRRSPRSGAYVAPEESTIRRMLKAVDADAVDLVVNAWVADQVAAGRLGEHIGSVELKAMLDAESDAASEPDDDPDDEEPDDPPIRQAIAVDGKTLRGARTSSGPAVHLMSAMTHAEGATVAQREVDTKTNEITGFRPLLENLDLNDVVVTADAMHAQRAHAAFLVGEKGAHYVFGVKDNQPSLAAAAERLTAHRRVVYATHEKGHGRIEHRSVRIASIPKALAKRLDFPTASQFVSIERRRTTRVDQKTSIETSHYVTDLGTEFAGARELALHIRGHWGIENRGHYVRDRVFDEDRSQVRTGGAPQVLATLRNLAMSILRLHGFKSIAAGLRWAGWDHRRAIALLGV